MHMPYVLGHFCSFVSEGFQNPTICSFCYFEVILVINFDFFFVS